MWFGDAALAVLVAVPAVISSLQVLRGTTNSPGWATVVITAVVVLHLALIGRRTWPFGSFAVASAAELALALAPNLDATPGSGILSFPPILLPSSIVFVFALYAVAAYGRRPAPGIALVIGCVGAVGSTARLAQADGARDTVLSGTWQTAFGLAALITAVAAAWSLGLSRRMHAAYVDALEEKAQRAEVERQEQTLAAAREERTRIAREMHDIVSHSLAVIVRQADAGRYAARADPAAAEQVLSTIAGTGREALDDMRSLLGVLRGTDAPVAGSGPQPTLADLDALIDKVRASGLAVAFSERGDRVPLDRASELAAYRLVQEALTNVAKHAGRAAAADVSLAWDGGGLSVTVTDMAGHPPADRGSTPGGQGLVGMRERLQLAGGTLTAQAHPDGGFVVHGRVPARGGRPVERGTA